MGVRVNEIKQDSGFKDYMSREEAMEILRLYRHWNPAQVGANEHEEALLNERRMLLKAAMRRLQQAEV